MTYNKVITSCDCSYERALARTSEAHHRYSNHLVEFHDQLLNSEHDLVKSKQRAAVCNDPKNRDSLIQFDTGT